MHTALVILFLFATPFVAKCQNVYLRELTIYQTHETSIPFITNYPEVYLSCEDGLDSIRLSRVRRTKELYVFETGAQPTTVLGSDLCVKCRLKEEDPVISDQTFGTWTMCFEDFEATGSNTVEVQNEFTALFLCPGCQTPDLPPEPFAFEAEPSVAFESEPPIAEFEALPSISSPEDFTEEITQTGVYGLVSDLDTHSQSQVSLQSSVEEGPQRTGYGKGRDGFSIWAIVGITLSVLIIGIAIGVAIVIRHPKLFSKIGTWKHGAFLGKLDAKVARTTMKKDSE